MPEHTVSSGSTEGGAVFATPPDAGGRSARDRGDGRGKAAGNGGKQQVTARGMARAVTDTTFGGKGEDHAVAGGVISYGVDISLGVPNLHGWSNRIQCGVRWGPIHELPRLCGHIARSPPLPACRKRPRREGACGILSTVSGWRFPTPALRIRGHDHPGAEVR